MSFNPVLFTLMLLLLGLLALSMGYRRRPNAVVPMRRVIKRLRRLAKRDPERFGPSLAINLRLYAVELMETGRPIQALVAIMTSVDLLRALSNRHPHRFEKDLADSIAIEDKIKAQVGVDPGMDLHALAEAEEEERDAYDRFSRRRSRAAFYWQIALIMWILSVGAFAYASLGTG